MTTFTSYGKVEEHRQAEIIQKLDCLTQASSAPITEDMIKRVLDHLKPK